MIKDYQKEVDDWAQQFKKPYFPIFHQLGCLVEEVGELSREINHTYGSKKKNDWNKGVDKTRQ